MWKILEQGGDWMPLETAITDKILKYLNKVPNCVAEKAMGNAFQKDKPDIEACWEGRSVKIEVKSPDHGNKPTKGQELNLKKWAKAGALCVVVWSLEEVKNLIEHKGLYNDSFTGWYFTEDRKIIKGGHE